MRTSDLIAFGLATLSRQKLRTLLTLIGVVIGTATLVVSIAVGLGVREVVDEQFRKEKNLRQISVFPNHDGFDESFDGIPEKELDIPSEMGDAKRERIRKMLAARYKRRKGLAAPKPLTTDRIAQLRQIPHVVDVVPELSMSGRVFFSKKSSGASVYGVPYEERRIDYRIEVGGHFSAPDAKECLVHEFLLYNWEIRDDADVHAIIGRTLYIEITNARRTPLDLLRLTGADTSNLTEEEVRVLEKTWKLLPQAIDSLPLAVDEKAALAKALARKAPGTKAEEDKTYREYFKIVGVVRGSMKDDPNDDDFALHGADIIIPSGAAEPFFMQMPRLQENGYNRVRVIVDHEDNLEEVVAGIKTMGLHEFSLGVIIKQIRRSTMLIGFTMDFIALIALIVAAVGITNTMFTTVLERTREIGIMKAIGAKDRQILTMFLIEGSLIGLLGGTLGVVFGWLASFPGNNYALNIMEKQGHKPLPETIFLYPLWLLISVPLFAMLMTTAAALLPARRAARVEPVVALRHE